jgi:hypothetical protein
MRKRLLIILVILSPIFWFAMHLSFSLFLFYWRIILEPGAIVDTKGLLLSHPLLFLFGLAGTITINVLFLTHKEKRAWMAWVANSIASILYIPFLILTVLMMA